MLRSRSCRKSEARITFSQRTSLNLKFHIVSPTSKQSNTSVPSTTQDHAQSIRMQATTIFKIIILSSAMETISAGMLRGQLHSREEEQRPHRSLADLISYANSWSTNSPPSEKSEIPSICLEIPDDPICDKLHQMYFLPEYITQSEDKIRRDTRPATAPTGIPTPRYEQHQIATTSPTRDLCYGNMAKYQHGKYCHSEMPSVSVEPSDQPTSFPFPSDDNSQVPLPTPSPTTQAPSERPSMAPSARTEPPSERPSASPSIQITDSPTIPEGHQFSYDEDEEEDRDGNGAVAAEGRPDRPVDPSAFRLKLYWQEGYYWQEETFERKWCMRCSNNFECSVGEPLFLGDCGRWSKSAYFEFVYLDDNKVVQIQVVSLSSDLTENDDDNSTKLCLGRGGNREVTLQECRNDSNNEGQRWTASRGSFTTTGDRFEISDGNGYCLTNHHHPKYGEQLDLYPCKVPRHDTTNYWNVY
eukprot:scaffold305_cov110-Cylindrotheca_fusiformis.AAC.24